MSAEPVRESTHGWLATLLVWTIPATLFYFFAWHGWAGYERDVSTLGWFYHSWNEWSFWRYGWVVVTVMAALLIRAARGMKPEPVRFGGWGLFWIALGLLLHVEAIRGRAVRFSLPGLVLIIFGSVYFVAGWKRARHLLFPLSLTLFLIPFQGIEQITNYFLPPARRLAAWLFKLMGGDTYRGGWGSWVVLPDISFQLFIPVLLAAILMARFCHHSPAGRLLIIALAPPIVFLTAAVRAALYEWAYWKRIGWFHEYWRGEFDLPLVLAFSVSCFAIACRLTGGMDQRSRKAAHLLPADGGPSLR